MNQTLIIVGGIIVLVVLIVSIILSCYKKAPSNIAYVLSGIKKQPRILIGTGGVKVPFFERLDKLFLGQVTVDIKTEQSVPTSDFINVDVDAVAKVAVSKTPQGLQLAAKNFLNMSDKEIAYQLQDSLQGNMREIIGTIDLKSLNNDRDGFSDKVAESAAKDMEKLGIEILSCNIQNITDREGLIENMGADNTWKIKKDAANAKAVAQKEIAIVEAENAKLANDAQVASQTQIAERNNELAIKRANLKKESDTQKAIADAAYQIQKQETMKTVNTKTVEAEIIKAQKEQELTAEQIKIQQNKLEAKVNRTADANKYQVQKNAEATLEQQKRDAEAKLYLAQQDAEAKKAQAEATKYSMEQEAAGIKAKGEAEAYAIQKKGEAEAEAMSKKAEAYQKYNSAAVAQMLIDKLPEVASAVASPISSIKNLNVYSADGNAGSQVSGQIPVVVKQVFDTMHAATGVDMADIVKSNTIQAKTNRNFDVDIKK